MQIYLKWFRNICHAILLMFYQTYHRREQQRIRFICVAISLHDFIRIFHFSAFFTFPPFSRIISRKLDQNAMIVTTQSILSGIISKKKRYFLEFVIEFGYVEKLWN